MDIKTPERPDIKKRTEKLAGFFPPDLPESELLLRLAIIRDDLEYECRNLPLDDEANEQDAWRTTYFIRRISGTMCGLDELCFEVGKLIKGRSDSFMKTLAPRLKDTVGKVQKAAELLKPIRNALGSHVAPQNSLPGADGSDRVAKRVLQHAGNLWASIEICMDDCRKTSFRGVTSKSLLFAWPDVSDDNRLKQRHKETSEAIFGCTRPVLESIDALLFWHWQRLEVLRGIGIRDRKTGDLVPIDSGDVDEGT